MPNVHLIIRNEILDKKMSSGGSRHSHQTHGGRSSHHGKDHGKKQHKGSRREKDSSINISSCNVNDGSIPSSSGKTNSSASGQRGGGFELSVGIGSSARRIEDNWSHEQPTSFEGLPSTPPVNDSPSMTPDIPQRNEESMSLNV